MFKLSLLPKVKRILLYLLQANDEIHWHSVFDLRTFARNVSNMDFFLKILPLKDDDDDSDVRNVKKKMGGGRVTDFALEGTCPEEHLNLSKSGFVSE